MKPVSRSLLNRLLSGSDGLSAVDKEDILERVLKGQPRIRRGWRTTPALGWGLAAVAASLIAVVYFQGTRSIPADEFSARGTPAPQLEIGCMQDEVRSPCREGSRLLFKVGPGNARFFSAVALGRQQSVLWYFDALDLKTLPSSGVLPQAPLLGPEHGTGELEVVAIFSSEPLSKSQVRSVLEAGEGLQGAVVLRRAMTIEP